MLKSLFGKKQDTITLFECKRCGYSRNAHATIKRKVRISPVSRTTIAPEEAIRGKYNVNDWILLKDMGDVCCESCKRPVLIKRISRDACPHRWRKSRLFRRVRYCALCNKEEEGEVVFDEKDT